MMKRNRALILFFSMTILVGLACATLQRGVNPEPTETPIPKGDASAEIAEYGGSRLAPYPPGELVPAFTISVEVADWVRGGEAWEILSQVNFQIDKLPEGFEYACVRMIVVNDLPGLSRTISRQGFYLTGDWHVRYPPAGIVNPKPVLGGELDYRGQMRGWNCYLVPKEEENLMVVVDLTGLTHSDGEFITYIGLREDTSVSPSGVSYQPTSAGLSQSTPAAVGEPVFTELWEVRVLDVVRGEKAFEQLLEANQFNKQPPEGMEYVMAYVEAAYYGEGDALGEIDGLAFKSIGAEGERYNAPSVVDPIPALEHELFPGGKVTGWVTVLADVNEPEMTLIYAPRGVYDQDAARYLSLVNQ